MSTVTIRNVVQDSAGHPVPLAVIHITLRASLTGNMPGYVGGASLGSAAKITADRAGAWSADLVPNGEIVPLNSWYEVIEDGYRSTIIVPPSGGPYNLSDVLVDVATPLTPPFPSVAYVDGAKAAAIATSEAYTDTSVGTEAAARAAADSAEATARVAGDTATLASAHTYTDGAVASEASARTAGDSATLASAEGYADTAVAGEASARVAGDAATLTSAEAYADSTVAVEATARASAVTAEASARASGDTSTLSSANTYTDTSVAAEAGARGAADALLVPKTRSVATTAPLTGGGDLSADRTLGVSGATTGAVGVVQLAGDLAGTATAPTVPRLATEAAARVAGDALAVQKASNLSDLANAGTARTNLGLGTAATHDVPASGDATASQTVLGADSRMTNARTPIAHASTHAPAGTDVLSGLTAAVFAAGSVDGTAGTASLRTLGTGAQQATAGNDTRLSDTRTPTDGSVTAAKLATGAVTSAAILDGTIVDADISGSAGIAASKVSGTALTAANNLSDLTASTARTNLGLGTMSTRDVGTTAGTGAAGDDSRIVNAVQVIEAPLSPHRYGVVGDGVADDTANINTALSVAAGGDILFERPSSFYRISDALAVPANTRVLGTGYGCEIRQMTQYKPVFDLLNVDGCTISGMALTLSGGPLSSMGGSFRGDAQYVYCAGVWANGSYHTIGDLRIKDFSVGVYLNTYNGTSLGAGPKYGNVVRDIEVSGSNFGLLVLGQTGLRVRGLYSHDHVDSSSGVNPTHAIYVTGGGASNAVSVDVVATGCMCYNNTTGQAFQFKYVNGLIASGLRADTCAGLLNGIDLFDASLTDLASHNDQTTGTSVRSLWIQKVANQPQRIQIANVSIAMAADGLPMLVIADDVHAANLNLITNHTGAFTQSYDAAFRGTNVTVDGIRIHNVGSAQYRAVCVGATGYTTGNVTVSNLACNNTANLVDFDATVTGNNVVDYAPGLQAGIGTGTSYIDQLNGTAAFAVSRREWTNTYTVTGGGTYHPKPPLETVTRFNVTDGTAFTISTPICQPKLGMVQEIVVANASGGALGTVTWNVVYVFAAPFVTPAAGTMSRVTFVYDGTSWHEIARSPAAGLLAPVVAVSGLATVVATASRWVGSTASGAPGSGTWTAGDWYPSLDGNVYICTVGGTPGTWVAVGTPASVTALAADALTTGEIIPPRYRITSAAIAPLSGTLALTYFTADKTEDINTLTAYSGGVAAAATPTLVRYGVYSVAGNGDLTLVASTPNDTSLLAVTNTAYPKGVSATFHKVAGTRYATAYLCVSSTTMPTLHGLQLAGTNPVSSFVRLSPPVVGRLTGQTDLPNSIAAASLVGWQAMVAMQLS